MTLPKKSLKKYDYNIDMEKMKKKDLKKLTKGQLIELLLKQKKSKKPKVVIVDDTKPTRLNRPPPIPEVAQRIKSTPPPRTGKWENVKPKPIPRKSVKQMVKEYEDLIQPPEQFRDGYKPIPKPRTDDRLPLQMRRYPKPTRKEPPLPITQVEDHIIQPPEQFRDGYKPIPKPRTDDRLPLQMRRYPKPTRKEPPLPITQVEDHIIQPPEQFRDGYKPLQMRRPPKPTRKPSPQPITVPKIKKINKALKGHAKSYEIKIQDNSNPLNHFTKTKELVESHLESLLKDMKGFKFIETLEITFEKYSIDSITGKRVRIYKRAFFNSKAKTITKANDIEHELSMSRQEILNQIDQWVSEGSGWVIDRIDSHYINVTTYTPLHGSNYIELPTELKNPKERIDQHKEQR